MVAHQVLSFQLFHLFFPGVPSSRNYITTEIHLNHYKASPCVVNFTSFYHPFITGVLHGGSTWCFIKDPFHSSIVRQDFSWSQDPPSYILK